MRYLFVFITMLFFVSFNYSFVLADNVEEAEKLNKEGLKYYEEKNYEKALEYFTKALEYYKEKTIYNNKGLAYYNLKDYEKAAIEFKNAIDLDPAYVNAWYNRGSSLLNLEKYEEAINCFDEVLKLDPSHSKAKEKKAQAEAALAAQAGEKEGEEWFLKGKAFYEDGKYSEAIDCFNKALEIDPAYPEAEEYIKKSQEAMAAQGATEEAKKEFEKGLDLLSKGDMVKAGDCFKKAGELDPAFTIEASSKMVDDLGAYGEFENMLYFLDIILALDPQDWQAYFLKGVSLKNLGNIPEAIKCFDTVLAIKPDHREAKIEKEKLEEALKGTENTEAALKEFQKGMEFFREGKIEEAKQAFIKSFELSPEAAIKACQEATETLSKESKDDEIIKFLDLIVEIQPDACWPWFGRYMVLASEGNIEEAALSFKKAWDINLKATEDACEYVVKSFVKAEKYEEVCYLMDAVLLVFPDNINSLFSKGKTLMNLERYEEAIECFNKVLELDPQHPEAKKIKKEAEKLLKDAGVGAPEMVLIPEGIFKMGNEMGTPSEKPVHTVEISSFYISKFEITNEQYCEFLNAAGNQTEEEKTWIEIKEEDKMCGISGGPEAGTFNVKSGYENLPVVYVTWYGAVAYCNWLSEKKGLEKCYGEPGNRGNVALEKKGYRLPTEAEWEYACRAGTNTLYYWGDKMNGDYCWYRENSGGDHKKVGTKKPNDFGLYDMSGNVYEWCSDWEDKYFSTSLKDPAGPPAGDEKIVRGGACCGWTGGPLFCGAANATSSCRHSQEPVNAYCNLGFRIVKSR